MEGPVAGVAGLLLTGGRSRRMGMDKARLRIGSEPAAVRLGRRLARVTGPALEVGQASSGLPSVPDPGEGPLVAVAAGGEALRKRGHAGPALVLACDLPLVGEALLRLLAGWPSPATVVPVVEGQPQFLCARLSPAALAAAGRLARAGRHRSERSMKAIMTTTPVTWLGPSEWGAVATIRDFTDTDSPADLGALGLDWTPG
jgi:molybdopterin-guanine dinucleotide biosynthesis protein A